MSVSWFFFLAVLVMVFIIVVITRSATDRGRPQIPRACPQCGEANPGQAVFCRKCGKALR